MSRGLRVGAPASGLHSFHPGVAGLRAQAWRRDCTRVPSGAPPGSSHAQATTEWEERMSNQEGAARWSLGHQRLRADLRSHGKD